MNSSLQEWIYTLHMYLSKSSNPRVGGIGLGAVYNAPSSAWDIFFKEGYPGFPSADSIAVIATRFPHTNTAVSLTTKTNSIIVRIAQDHNSDTEPYLTNVWTKLRKCHGVDRNEEGAPETKEAQIRELRKYVFQERFRIWFYKIHKYKAQARDFVAMSEEILGRESQVPQKIPLRNLASLVTTILGFIEDSQSDEDFRSRYCKDAFDELERSYPAYLKYAADNQVQASWQIVYDEHQAELGVTGLDTGPFEIKRFLTSLYLTHSAVNSLFRSLKSSILRKSLTLEFLQVETEEIHQTPSDKSDISQIVSEFLSAEEQKDNWFRPLIPYEDIIEKQLKRVARPVHAHCDCILFIHHLINQSSQNPLPNYIGNSKYTGTCFLCQIFIRSVEGGVGRNILFRADQKICIDWRLPKTLPPGVQPEDVEKQLKEVGRKELERSFSLKKGPGKVMGEGSSDVLILI